MPISPVLQNQRPGVYSQYDVSSLYAPPRSSRCAAVAARASGGETGRLLEITSLQQLTDAVPPDQEGSALRGCVQILLHSGVGKVYAVAVQEDCYEDAFALLESLDNVGAVVCDCGDDADRKALRDFAHRCAAAQREQIAFCGEEDPQAARDAAAQLNSERTVLCCPAVEPVGIARRSPAYAAAALAGKILAAEDPTRNFSGESLTTVLAPDPLPESDIQALLAAGVSVLEQNSGAVECIRALTTRTKTAGEPDHSLRGINTVLCIDNVLQDLRAALKAALRGIRQADRSLQAIRSQAVVVLAEKKDAGIIEQYAVPVVFPHREDPAVCVVELSFHIAHVVNQIHVTAHIQA